MTSPFIHFSFSLFLNMKEETGTEVLQQVSQTPVHIKVHQADNFIYPKSKVTAQSVLCNEAYVCQYLSEGWKQWCHGFFCIIIRASRSLSRPPNRPSSQSQSLVMSSGRDKVIVACHYVRAETQTNENESPLVKEKWQ